jgi:hypothetical protein
MSESVFWIVATIVSFACLVVILSFIAMYDRRKKKKLASIPSSKEENCVK